MFALSATLLRSEVAMLALLDAGPLPPTAYLGTSLALHLVLGEHRDVHAVLATMSAPWPSALAAVLQGSRDMALIVANEARALLRHGVATRAFGLPWTRVIAHSLEVHATRLDVRAALFSPPPASPAVTRRVRFSSVSTWSTR